MPKLNAAQADKMKFQSENSCLHHFSSAISNHYPVVHNNITIRWILKKRARTKSRSNASVHMRSPNADTQQNRTWQSKINTCELAIDDMKFTVIYLPVRLDLEKNLLRKSLMRIAKYSQLEDVRGVWTRNDHYNPVIDKLGTENSKFCDNIIISNYFISFQR